jgi:hypothetical protein
MSENPEEKVAESSKPRRKLKPAALRALREAEQRRKARAGDEAAPKKETGGRDGPDPVRYGDWEKDGIVSDF